jgi:hypothetical protein
VIVALQECELQHRIDGSSASVKADDVDQCERALEEGREFVARLAVFPISRCATATLFISIRRCDFFKFFATPAVGLRFLRFFSIAKSLAASRSRDPEDVAFVA